MQGLATNPGQQNQAPSINNQQRTSTIDVPVRILVPSESVGAIIGKGGQTIRQLTQQTRAKVDVYRGDPMAPSTALQEKVITIRGQPENCINACREILKVMKADSESKGKPSDTPLKVLAHNDYIGRIIGKQGNIINTIKKETDTSVTVSSINDMSMNVERVITVKGELENMIRALEVIHSKVKSAFENDTKTYGAQAIMMGGIPPLPIAPQSFAATSAAAVAAAAAAAAAFNPTNLGHHAGPTGGGANTNSAARYAAAAAAAAAAAQQQHSQQVGNQGPHNHQPGSGSSNQNNPSGGAGVTQSSSQYASFHQQQQQPIYHYSAHHQSMQQPGGPIGNLYQSPNLLAPQSLVSAASHHNQGNQDMMMMGGPEPETVYLYIPNVAVGAIIGTKGSYIKNIIKLSGASVKITPLSPEESKTAIERQVVIVGTPESQWKAQYYIYDKIRQERFASDENVKLRAELQVPSQIVGRIIGKSGKNVRELQRSTGATIKLPEDVTNNNGQQDQQVSENVDTVAPTTTTQEVKPNEEQSSVEETAVKKEEEQAKPENEAAKTESSEVTSEQNSKIESSNDQQVANTATNANVTPNTAGYVIVRIFGTFQASQCAQRRIQTLVSQSLRLGNNNNNESSMLNNGHHGHQQHQRQHFNNQMNLVQLTNHYQRNDYSSQQQHLQQQPRMNGYNNRHNRRQQNQHHSKEAKDTNNSVQNSQAATTGEQPATTTTTNNNNAQSPSVSSSSSSSTSSTSSQQQQQQQQQQQPQTAPIIAATS